MKFAVKKLLFLFLFWGTNNFRRHNIFLKFLRINLNLKGFQRSCRRCYWIDNYIYFEDWKRWAQRWLNEFLLKTEIVHIQIYQN